MQKRSVLFNIFLIIGDTALIVESFVMANFLKEGRFSHPIVLLAQNSKLLIFAIFTIMAIFTYFSIYEANSKRNELDEVSAIIGALTMGMILFELLTMFYRDLMFKRMTILYAWMISSALVSVLHILAMLFVKQMYRMGIGTSNVIIIGLNDVSKALYNRIHNNPQSGLRFLGFVATAHGKTAEESAEKKIVGVVDDLSRILVQKKISKVIFSIPEANTNELMKLIDICSSRNVQFQFVPRMLDIIESRISTDEIAGVPLVSVREIKLYGLNALLKRSSDIIFTCALLAIFSPILLIVGVIIKLDSKGSVFFKQRRVGKNGKEFDMFKFRSMVVGAENEIEKLSAQNEANGLIFKIKNDPRITRVGRFIRRWSIDELPQMLNVLKGDMGLVGPRPPIPGEVIKYNSWHKKRLHINPGITGLWQVSGRSDISFEEMVKLDIFYIENWSLWLDIKILIKTILVVLLARGAY